MLFLVFSLITRSSNILTVENSSVLFVVSHVFVNLFCVQIGSNLFPPYFQLSVPSERLEYALCDLQMEDL